VAGAYRAAEHTADLALEVEADSLEELFEYAARGMFDLIRGDAPPPEAPGLPTWRPIAFRAADRESLLVAWLSELLYVHAAEGLWLAGIRGLEVAPDELRAEVGWTPLGSAEVDRELKGVTYHDLAVERRPDGRWHARIVFDV